jgi:hypothetical protein
MGGITLLFRWCNPHNFRIALPTWSNVARPGSNVDTPFLDTENVRKKILSLGNMVGYAGLPLMARIVLSLLFTVLGDNIPNSIFGITLQWSVHFLLMNII